MSVRATILCLAACPLASCSSFERCWEAGLASPQAAGLAGCWEGTWRSDVNGHTGGLRALVRPRDPAGSEYEMRYHATYALLFLPLSYEYALAVAVEERDGAYRFRGEADLGWLAGGVYRYEGSAHEDVLRSTYRSGSDHGVFELARVTR